MRKKFTIILLCIISMIGVVGILFWSTKHTESGNGFIRRFPPHFLSNWKILDIENPYHHLLGISSKSIYTGSTFNPKELTEINHSTGKIKKHTLNFSTQYKIAWKALKIHVDSMGVYITEGITPTILHSNLHSFRPVPLQIDSIHFTSCLPISSDSYILKTYDNQLEQNILARQTLNPIHTRRMPDILEKQIDGVFCTDGELLFNRKKRQLVYVYRYRNEFIGMDTELNILYKGKTIDTNKLAKIKIAEIGTGINKRFTHAIPPLTVNKKSYAYGNFLFISSALMSTNETPENFRKNAVIDVYSLPDTQYLYSFYIPAYKEKSMRDFAVYEKTLFTLFDNHLITFQMNL